jgi:hypothetical protein
LNLVLEGDARVANGAVVSANYIAMLGLQLRLGRFFLALSSPEAQAKPRAAGRQPTVTETEPAAGNSTGSANHNQDHSG